MYRKIWRDRAKREQLIMIIVLTIIGVAITIFFVRSLTNISVGGHRAPFDAIQPEDTP